MRIDKKRQEVVISFKELEQMVEAGILKQGFLDGVLSQQEPQVSEEDFCEAMLEESKEESRGQSPEKLADRMHQIADTVCTKELFDYFELAPKKALAELQAALYPVAVGFHEASYTVGDEVWRTPCIVFMNPAELKEKSNTPKFEYNGCLVYRNNHGQLFNYPLNVFDIKSFASASKEKWLEYAIKKKSKLKSDRKPPIYLHSMSNPLTGESYYVMSQPLGCETVVALRAGQQVNYDWYQARRGKDGEYDNCSEQEKRFIAASGREAIRSAHDALYELGRGLEKS